MPGECHADIHSRQSHAPAICSDVKLTLIAF
jgi:hypothetical protein